jgi:hypothetical protein
MTTMERYQDSTTMTDAEDAVRAREAGDTIPTRDEQAADRHGGAIPTRDARDLESPTGGIGAEAEPQATADTVEAPDAGRLTTRDLASPSQTGTPPDETADEERPRTDVDTSSTQPLFPHEINGGFQRQWEEIQTRFVDEPRAAVQDADKLVAHVMQQLAQSFADEHERLEAQWGRGEDISTEDLRVSLQRYRSFFQRLLST